MRNLQLPQGLPLFEPKQRLAILVNNWDRYEGYRRSDIHSRGNRRIYDMEFYLTGGHSFPDPTPDEQIAMQNLDELESVLKDTTFGERMSGKESWRRERSDRKYETCVKIFPDQSVSRAFNEATVELGRISSPETLTFVYFNSHGIPDNIGIDNGHIEYRHLLTLLERISGKKVVFIPSCHSGSILTATEFIEQARDYVLLTSARREQKSITWGDDELDRLLSNHLYSNEPLSAFQLPEELSEMGELMGEQNPLIIGHFDVYL